MRSIDLDLNRTIVAVASATGPAIRGIVRLSGFATREILNQICDPPIGAGAGPQSVATRIRIAECDAPVDASVLVWPTSRSYTRQPAAEIHTIGCPPILEAIVAALCRCGAAMARPGEFTLRAFLAGRLDLSQAEAVIAAVDASSAAEFSFALDQCAGGLRHPLDRLRDELLELLARLEAGLDFVEDDIEFISRDELADGLGSLLARTGEILRQVAARRHHEEGWCVVLMGQPNAGKSSLFNALVGRPAAIASETAGTTRDYLAETIRLGDFQVRLIDTAGGSGNAAEALPGGSIDSLAADQSRTMIDQADLRLLCVEQGTELNQAERSLLRAFGQHVLRIATKCDLRGGTADDGIPVSPVTGEGLAKLRQSICDRLASLSAQPWSGHATTTRCGQSLEGAQSALLRAQGALGERAGDEIIAAELRAALEELGRVVGAVYTDDLLDRIFSRFCIGK